MILDDIEDFEEVDEPEETPPVEAPKPKREDKIFNNRYNLGEGLKEGEETNYSRRISVAHDYANRYLKDLYEYEESLEARSVLDSLFEFIKGDEQLNEIFERLSNDKSKPKAKFTKDEVNFIFERINSEFDRKVSGGAPFYSPIYVLEVISVVSTLEYKKLFDMLNTDIQEILLVELNKKYRFLDGKLGKKRIH